MTQELLVTMAPHLTDLIVGIITFLIARFLYMLPAPIRALVNRYVMDKHRETLWSAVNTGVLYALGVTKTEANKEIENDKVAQLALAEDYVYRSSPEAARTLDPSGNIIRDMIRATLQRLEVRDGK